MSRGSFYDNTNEEELIASTQTNSTNAASSATAAAASAASAAASYDAFDDRYLGTKSSDPTTDNDSNTLLDGALYFNTSNNVMMVYDLGNTTWNRTTPTSSDQTKINTVSGIQANVTTVAGISSDVTTVAGISSDVAAVENIAANVTSVAGIASNVTSVAGNATNINAVAGNATNINAATTKAAEAATSATAAASSATTATTKASEAASSATGAASSATAASSSASGAATSATNAAASAASAAATYDNFDDRYLGSKSSAPTVDNDGNALVVGALYYDSTASAMKVYTASGWIATSSATLATMERFVFTATAGQTVFTGADAGGDTLAIVVGAEMVTLNGVVLEVTADYTVTTSRVTLNSGAAVGDELNVYAFGNFEIANHYTKTQADALYDAKASLSGAAFTGAITTNSTFDGRDVATDGTKLDGIEASATADQTNAEIRTAVEAASDSNVFTDADHTKLNAIAASANNYVHPNHSGDVTSSADGATTIANNAVTTAKIADDAVTADKLANSINTEIAANTAKVGITTSQANAITANTAKVTNATHTGEVTGATALTIANDAVTVAKLNLVSTSSVPSLEAKGDGSSQDGYIQLNCSQNSHGIKLKSPPHSANASYTLTFPNDDGSANQKLTTNGSGVLTWTDDNATDATKLPLAGGTLTGSVKGSTDTDTSNTGSVTLDFSANQNFVLTLTGNVTLANPSTEAIGQSGFITFIQDGTGSRTVALGTDYETAGAAGLTLTSTASATDIVPYIVVASNRILLGAPQLAFA